MLIPVTIEQVQSGGALVGPLEQHTASGSATLDFTSFVSGLYDHYVIDLINVLPATNAVDFYLRVSTDGGSSYDTGNNYTWNRIFQYGVGTNNVEGAQNVAFINLATSQANTQPVQGKIDLYSPSYASGPKVFWVETFRFATSVSVYVRDLQTGIYQPNTAINAIQFLFSSGNIASGTIRIYGIAK